MTRLHSVAHRLADAPGAASVALALFILIVLGVIAAPYLVRSITRAAAFGVVLLGVTMTWWLVNGPLEGRVLVAVSMNHGFTLADTLGIPALLVSMGVFFTALWRHRARSSGPDHQRQVATPPR